MNHALFKIIFFWRLLISKAIKLILRIIHQLTTKHGYFQVFSIRDAAANNLKRLAEEFGPEWAMQHIVPQVCLQILDLNLKTKCYLINHFWFLWLSLCDSNMCKVCKSGFCTPNFLVHAYHMDLLEQYFVDGNAIWS